MSIGVKRLENHSKAPDALNIDIATISATKYGIIFEGSGCYQNGDKHIDNIDIELLVWIYDWLLDNEEELFEE